MRPIGELHDLNATPRAETARGVLEVCKQKTERTDDQAFFAGAADAAGAAGRGGTLKSSGLK